MAETLWTIDQLASAVERTFHGVDEQPSGRVRDVPDKRTIRYYTTLGLVDRASEMRGRTAYYGRKHLLQLAAIKRLQAQGRSLVEIQAQLAGAEVANLERWAQLPADFALRLAAAAPNAPAASDSVSAAEAPAPRADADSFWAAPVEPPRFEPARYEASATQTAMASSAEFASRRAIHLVLADGVTLVLEGPAREQMERLSREEQGRLLADAAERIQELLDKGGNPLPPPTICQRPDEGGPHPIV